MARKTVMPIVDNSVTARGKACGRCRKPTGYVKTWDCPHCGSDLRQAGVSRRQPIYGSFGKYWRHLRTHGVRRVDSSVCGNCGYGIHPEQGFQCPECHADLREVGVWANQGLSRKDRAFFGLTLFVVAWTALSVLLQPAKTYISADWCGRIAFWAAVLLVIMFCFWSHPKPPSKVK